MGKETERGGNWIQSRADVLGGKPCVAGTRLSVEFILELLAGGASPEQIAQSYPAVPQEAVRAALAYAARSIGGDRSFEVEVRA